MFEKLKKWWAGEMLDGVIISTGNKLQIHGAIHLDHTVILLPSGERLCATGILGVSGEKIKINSWNLWSPKRYDQ